MIILISWVIFSIFLFFLFNKKILGIFDPLLIYLVTRLATLFSAVIYILILRGVNLYLLLSTAALIINLTIFYYLNPNTYFIKKNTSQIDTKNLLTLAIILFILKFLIISYLFFELPLFSGKGSNGMIKFDYDNKILNTFLFGISNTDLAILLFLYNFLKSAKLRALILILILISMIIILLSGKKSAFFGIFFTICFVETIRIKWFNQQKSYFLNKKIIIFGIFLSVVWGILILVKTEAIVNLRVVDIINNLEALPMQWAYPYIIFSNGDLDYFFNKYQVDKILYFFHPVIVAFNIRAFEYSIGPSINLYRNGFNDGSGINPTMVIEGFVLFGLMMPFYVFTISSIAAIFRRFVFKLQDINIRFLFTITFLTFIYSLFIDGLYFVKQFYINCFIFSIYFLSSKFKLRK